MKRFTQLMSLLFMAAVTQLSLIHISEHLKQTSAVRWLVSASGARSEEAYREAYAIRRQVVLSFGVHLHPVSYTHLSGNGGAFSRKTAAVFVSFCINAIQAAFRLAVGLSGNN